MPLYEYICNTPECETKSFEILTTFNSENKDALIAKNQQTKKKNFINLHFLDLEIN